MSSLALSLSAFATTRSKPNSDLYTYRGFLSLVAALDVKVISIGDVGSGEWIGEGTYTTVYQTTLAEQPTVHVCLKESKAILSYGDPAIAARTVHSVLCSVAQELRIMAHKTLRDHPNIPNVIGVAFREENFQTVRPLFLVELACGTLSSCVDNLDWRDRQRLCRDVADGLVALHSLGVVHGDVKPENVLVFRRANGLEATISDMGSSGPEGTTEIIPGTRIYYAPECFSDSELHSEYVNKISRDVYAFGILLCELALGVPVFQGLDWVDQFSIQVDDGGLRYIKDKLIGAENNCGTDFLHISFGCLPLNPSHRLTMVQVSRQIANLLEENRVELLLPSEFVDPLLQAAGDPRIRYTSNIAMNPALGAKLFSEYSLAARETEDVRVALYMAAFYSGFFGADFASRSPYDLLARAQWALKAIELGSALALNDKLWEVPEHLHSHVLSFRDVSFQSPQLDLNRLTRQLQIMRLAYPDDALKLLEYLGIDKTTSVITRSDFERLTVVRKVALKTTDNDAMDLMMASSSPFNRAAYNNDVAYLHTLFLDQEVTLEEKAGAMEAAIFAGSLEVVKYLCQYGDDDINLLASWISPGKGEGSHNLWKKPMTSVDIAALYGRASILEFLLGAGGTVTMHHGISALHLCSAEKDNAEVADIICRHLRERGMLADALKWTLDISGYTPFLCAVGAQCWAVAAVLLQYGADPNAAINHFNPLIQALVPCVPVPPFTFIKSLVEAGVSLQGIGSETPLHWAVKTTNLSATVLLLLADADVSAYNDQVKTPLEEAEENALEELANFVKDVDGRVIEDGPAISKKAAQAVLAVLQVAAQGSPGWKEQLREELERTDEDILNRIWVASSPSGALLQISIPSE